MTLSPGREIKAMMALRGVTSREVARRAGISVFILSRIVNGRRVPDPELLDRITLAIASAIASAGGTQ